MDELITKLNEIKYLLKDMNVINCTVSVREVDVLVSNFSDIPTEKGTEYVRRDSSCSMPYEKRFTRKGVLIHTYGTKQEMMKEFAEAE